MPYNIWCGGCEKHIGMGVRYNAEKTKVGMYYTTPIYKFRMKCHLCDNYFEIQTDPQVGADRNFFVKKILSVRHVLHNTHLQVLYEMSSVRQLV